MKKTVRELGYGSATWILRWLRETVPDKVSKPVQRNWKVDYPEEIKQAAVIDLCESNSSTADIAEKYGISRHWCQTVRPAKGVNPTGGNPVK